MKNKFKILLIVIVIFCVSCQPTPEEEIIVKTGEYQENMTESTVLFSEYEVPQNWQHTIDMKGDNSQIVIDAEIIVPEVDYLPVYGVSQSEFTAEQIEKFVAMFSDEVYTIGELTKSDIEEIIINLKKEGDDEGVAEYAKLLSSAPDQSKETLITDWTPSEERLWGEFENSHGEKAQISANKTFFSCSYGQVANDDLLKINNQKPVGELSISQEEAIEIATQKLTDSGLSVSAYDVQKAAIYQYEANDNERKEGYSIRFARNVDGITGMVDEGITYSPKDDLFNYAAPFHPEEVRLFIGENGEIYHMELWNPQDLGTKEVSNVSILSFEEISNRIENLLVYINSYDGKVPTNVTKVSLHMSIVSVKDYPGQPLYIPVWLVDYYRDYGDYTQEYQIAVNAIDGGRTVQIPMPTTDEVEHLIDAAASIKY